MNRISIGRRVSEDDDERPPRSGVRNDVAPRNVPVTQPLSLNAFLQDVEKRAFRIALLATRNRDDALDIVQEAMCKLAQNYGQRCSDEWGPLFHTILQSRIRDWYRREKVRSVFLLRGGRADDAEAMDMVADGPGWQPDEQLKQQHAVSQLEKALQALPLRQQQVFLLRVWEGYDVAQTAGILKVSQGSVKTHFSRAVAALRDKLGDHWP